MDEPCALGETAREDAETRADLEHDVRRAEIAESLDHTEDVLVDEEVLAQRLLGRDGHANPNAAAAFAWVWAASASTVLAPRVGEDTDRMHHVGGLVPRAAHRLGREVRAIGLDEDPVRRNRAGGLAQGDRIRKRHVAGERDVVATLDCGHDKAGRREAVEDHRAGERSESSGRLVVRFAIVDDDGEAELVGEGELRVEEAPLLLRSREATDGVEAGLAHRDRLRMSQELAELGEALGLGLPGLMRVDPERGMHAVVPLGDRERRPTRVDAGADRDDSGDAGCLCALDQGRGGLVARVEMRVRVGHAAVAASIRASSSATTCSGSSFAKSGVGSRSVCPGGSALGSHRPVQLE